MVRGVLRAVPWRRIGTILRRRKLFAASIVSIALTAGGTAAAAASTGPSFALAASQDLGACTANQQPIKNGIGLTGLLALPCLRTGNEQPTQFEQYNANAYGFNTSSLPPPNQNALSQGIDAIGQNLQGVVPGAASIQNDLGNALAAMVLGWVLAIGTLCAGTLEWTFTKEMAGGLISGPNSLNSGTLDLIIKYMGDHVYGAFMLLAVVIAGLWVVWHGVARRRMTVVVESLVWVVLATAVAALFMQFPSQSVGALDYLSLTGSQVVLGAVSQTDPTIHGAQQSPVYSNDQGNPSYAGLRSAVDRYWGVYVFTPWEVGEFGSIDFAKSKPNQAGQAPAAPKCRDLTFAQCDLEARQNSDTEMKNQLDAAIAAKTSANDPVRHWYQGEHGGERLAIMVLALFTVLIASALLIVIAGSVLLAQLGLVLLTLVAPLFFLVGIHPGGGRRIFVRWAELMIGLLLRRVIYSAFLAVILVVGGLIMATTANSSWGLAAVLQVALLVAAFIYRKPFAALFHQVGTGQLSPYFEPARERILRTVDRRTATERRAGFGFGLGGRAWEAYATGAAEGAAGAAGVAAGQAAAGGRGGSGGVPGKKVRRIAAAAAGAAPLATSGPGGAGVVAGRGTASVVGGAWRRIRRFQRRAADAGELAAGSNGRREARSSQQSTPLPDENGRRPAGKQPMQLRGAGSIQPSEGRPEAAPGSDDQLRRQDETLRQLRGKRRRDIRSGIRGRDIVPGIDPDRDDV